MLGFCSALREGYPLPEKTGRGAGGHLRSGRGRGYPHLIARSAAPPACTVRWGIPPSSGEGLHAKYRSRRWNNGG